MLWEILVKGSEVLTALGSPRLCAATGRSNAKRTFEPLGKVISHALVLIRSIFMFCYPLLRVSDRSDQDRLSEGWFATPFCLSCPRMLAT